MAPALARDPRLRTPLAVAAALVLAGSLAIASEHFWPSGTTITLAADMTPETVVATVKTGGTAAPPALRAALAASRAAPADAALALQAAEALIATGRATGDARLVGASLGILQPALALGDPQALTLAGIARQYQHDFTGSLALLDQAIDQDPGNIRAILTRATVQTVLGAFDKAGADCRALQQLGQVQIAFLCQSTALMLTDSAATVRQRLEAILASPGMLDPTLVSWATGLVGEIAAMQGERGTATARFTEVLATDPAAIRERLMLADLLLADGKGAGVLALLQGQPETDSLLLRRALAYRQTAARSSEQADSAELLRRFSQNIALGLAAHAREEARYFLQIAPDPQQALARAAVNWALQHELEDAQLLVDAALAADQPLAARPVVDWMTAQGLTDRLRALPNAITEAAR